MCGKFRRSARKARNLPDETVTWRRSLFSAAVEKMRKTKIKEFLLLNVRFLQFQTAKSMFKTAKLLRKTAEKNGSWQ